MKKKYQLILLCLFWHFFDLTSLHAQAPDYCGTAILHENLLRSNAEYRQRINLNETLIQKALVKSDPAARTNQTTGQVLVIPVVVHIVHLGEPIGTGNNISDAQVHSAITALNDMYRKKAGTYGDGDGVDMEIEFQLATRDPNCNPTNGIVRVNGSNVPNYATYGLKWSTVGADEAAIKSLSRWPNSDYYNVWVINQMDNGGGPAGYAYFPGAPANVDGTVIVNYAFGTIGTVWSSMNHSTTFAHEMGHAFNLYHTFEGDNGGTACPPVTNGCGSGQGDCIADTEPHKRSGISLNGSCPAGTINSCTNAPFGNVFKNYMDYNSQTCRNAFTQDQKDRVRAAITQLRPGLISTSSQSLATVSLSVPVAATCSPSGTVVSNNFGYGIYSVGIDGNLATSKGTVGDNAVRVDRTCSQQYNLRGTSAFPISITTGGAINENVKVFLDYNNNGNFTDAGELIFTSNNAYTHNGSFTPVAGKTNNTALRMRVISDRYSNTITGPCYVPQYGQIEDYTVRFITTDVAVSAITRVNIGCGLTNQETITITVDNLGAASLNNIPVSYKINNGTPVHEIVAGPLAPNTSVTYSFTTKANLSAPGTYNIEAKTNLTGDALPTNDTFSKAVTNYLIPAVPAVTVSSATTPCGAVIFTAASTTIGVTFQWFINGTAITNATSATYLANVAGNYTATATANGCSSPASVATVITQSMTSGSLSLPVAATCSPSDTVVSNNFGIGIYSVGIGSDMATSGGTVGENAILVDRTCSKQFNLKGSSAFPISITTGQYNNENVKVYLDYNNNGNFTDAGELIFTSNNAKTHNGTFTPAAGKTNNTALRMRVISDFYNSIADPCYVPQYGQVEDYTVRFITTDVAVSAITKANIGCGLTNQETITITVDNLGAASLNNIPVSYKINNGTPVNEIVAGPLAPNTSVSYSFTTKANLSAPGTYNIEAKTNLTGDALSTNDTFTKAVTNYTIAAPTVTASGATTLCTGSAVTLTAASTTTGVTFQWFKNGTAIANATSATYLANAAGSYTVTATANGCTSPASAATVITVNAVPASPTVTTSGATTLCTGSAVTLTAASATTGVSYQWFKNGTAIANATSATYTATAAGNYTVVATSGGCSATSVATTVTVNPVVGVPTVTAASPTTFCTGGSVVLTATSTTPGATYTWFLNGAAIPGATSAIYTANTAGSYAAVAAVGSCQSAASATTTVTVNTAPAIPTLTAGGATTFCSGGSVVLTANSTSTGATYTWSLNGTPIQSANSATFTATVAGNYTTTATYGGCSAISAPTTVAVNATPTTPTVTQAGFVLTSSSTTGNQWYKDNVAIIGATSQTYTTTSNGSYTVVVIDNGCQSSTSNAIFISTTGLGAAMNGLNVAVYPNPSDGLFHITLPEGSNYEMTVTDLTGKVIRQLTTKDKGTLLNISDAAKGIYFLKIAGEGKTSMRKLVVE